MEPVIILASSDRISPNILVVTIVKLLGVTHQLHGSIVHIHMVEGYIWKILATLTTTSRQSVSFQNIGLVNTGNLLLLFLAISKASLAIRSTSQRCRTRYQRPLPHFSCAFPALEIDSAGKFPYHHDIHALANDIRP